MEDQGDRSQGKNQNKKERNQRVIKTRTWMTRSRRKTVLTMINYNRRTYSTVYKRERKYCGETRKEMRGYERDEIEKEGETSK